MAANYEPGQVLTAEELNTSLDSKTDNANANITGGQIEGLVLLQVIGTTPSTSPSTGAMTVVGGVGIGASLNVGGQTSTNTEIVSGVTDSSSPVTGALTVAGGVGIGKNLNVGGSAAVAGSFAADTVSVTDVKDSTSPSTGALVTTGGVGIGKSLFVGGATNIAGPLAASGGATITKGLSVDNITVQSGGTITYPDGSSQGTAGAINGEMPVATTGGTTTITAAQSAANSIFKVTGILTSNAILVFPAVPKNFTVQNATTGSFTLTVQAAGQTPSTSVVQGTSGTLFTDSTGCYATSAASGVGFSGEFQDPTGITMSLTHMGALVIQTATGIRTTFPPAATYPAGKGIAIKNGTTGTTNIAFNAADTTELPLTLLAGDIFFVVADGVSKWQIGWYSAPQHPRGTDFTFGDGTTQSTANGVTAPTSTWYTVGTTNTVGSFAVGDTALLTSGFNAPLIEVIRGGLTATRGQHYTLNADGLHINWIDGNAFTALDQFEVRTKVIYSPSTAYSPSFNPITPAQGAASIPFAHVPGFASLYCNGSLQTAGVDYTEDANGFYFIGYTANGKELYNIWNLTPITIANMLSTISPIIKSGVLTFADGSQQGTAALSNRNYIVDGAFENWVTSSVNIAVAGTSNGAATMYYAYAGSTGATTISKAGAGIFAGTDVPGLTTPALNSFQFQQTTAQTDTSSLTKYPSLYQKVESVFTLQNRSATFSVWLKTASGTITIPGVCLIQNFGTGGSPSATVDIELPVSWNVTTVWQRFSIRLDIPSIVGGNLGSNSNDNLLVGMRLPANALYTFQTTQWQLEQSSPSAPAAGSPTPFEYRGQQAELARVQRYYETGGCFFQGIAATQQFVVWKRNTAAVSAVAAYGQTGTYTPGNTQLFSMTIQAGSSQSYVGVNWIADARL